MQMHEKWMHKTRWGFTVTPLKLNCVFFLGHTDRLEATNCFRFNSVCVGQYNAPCKMKIFHCQLPTALNLTQRHTQSSSNTCTSATAITAQKNPTRQALTMLKIYSLEQSIPAFTRNPYPYLNLVLETVAFEELLLGTNVDGWRDGWLKKKKKETNTTAHKLHASLQLLSNTPFKPN